MPQLRHALKSEGENPEKPSSSPPPRRRGRRLALRCSSSVTNVPLRSSRCSRCRDGSDDSTGSSECALDTSSIPYSTLRVRRPTRWTAGSRRRQARLRAVRRWRPPRIGYARWSTRFAARRSALGRAPAVVGAAFWTSRDADGAGGDAAARSGRTVVGGPRWSLAPHRPRLPQEVARSRRSPLHRTLRRRGRRVL